MASNEMTVDTQGPLAREAPDRKHHRCPWWGGPLMASSLRRLLEKPEPLLEPYAKPGMQVLDFGSAMGFFSLPLARMVGPEGRVVCLDVEPRMIAGLLKRARKAGLEERIEAVVCQEMDPGLAQHEGRFGFAVTIHTLHEVADIPGTLAQMHGSLVPGGRLLLVEPLGHVSRELYDFELEAATRAGFAVEKRLRLRRRFAAVLRKQP